MTRRHETTVGEVTAWAEPWFGTKASKLCNVASDEFGRCDWVYQITAGSGDSFADVWDLDDTETRKPLAVALVLAEVLREAAQIAQGTLVVQPDGSVIHTGPVPPEERLRGTPALDEFLTYVGGEPLTMREFVQRYAPALHERWPSNLEKRMGATDDE